MGDDSPGIPPDIHSLDIFSPSVSNNTPLKSAPKRSSNEQPEPINTPKRLTDPENPSPSIATIYTHPSMEIPYVYTTVDKGPFIVHVSRIESDPSSGLTLRPIKIGLFLTHNNINGISKGGVKSVGRNRVAIEFNTHECANNFIKNSALPQNNLLAIIPSYNITRLGLVRGVPCEWSMQEFVEAAQLPLGCGIILKARRLNRKVTSESGVNWVPTQSVVVTFAGQVLPKNIYCYYTSLAVETYLLPTIQCHNCCRFGHIKTQCRSKPRCYRCAQNHIGDSCDVEEASASCLFCSGNHFAINKKCSEQLRQKSIKVAMSQQNIPYIEAAQLHPPVRRTFSEAVTTPYATATNSHINDSLQQNLYNSSSQQSSQSRSYKKTIHLPSHPKATTSKGYDRQAHNFIIASPKSSSFNGSALHSSDEPNLSTVSPNENLIELVLDIFSNLVLKFNDCLPTNVAHRIIHLANLIRPPDGSGSPPAVEL